MKFTKFAFAAAFCALVVVQAEARTLYVNAKRPNNKGNGLKVNTAKKTIQAAINIARKGDTILVYPGNVPATFPKQPPFFQPRFLRNPAATAGGPPVWREHGALQAFLGGPGAVPAKMAKVPQEPPDLQISRRRKQHTRLLSRTSGT